MHQERHFPAASSAPSSSTPTSSPTRAPSAPTAALVERTEDFAAAFEEALAAGRPALLELRVDPEAITPRATLSQIRGRAGSVRSCATCSARRPISPPTSSSRTRTAPIFPRVERRRAARSARAGRCPSGRPTRARSSRELGRRRPEAAVAIPSGRYFGFVIGGARAGGARRRLADARRGTRTPGLYVGGPAASVVEEVAGALARRAARAAARTSRSPSSPGRRWRTRRRSPRRGTTCSREAAGTSSATAWPARRRSASSPARSATRRSTARCACLGLGTATRSSRSPRTTRAACAPTRFASARGAGGPTIVCAQAGEVNTGAFDPLEEIADAARGGRSVAARRRRVRALGGGQSRASRTSSPVPSAPTRGRWTAHKWLNVPYDSGIVVLRPPRRPPRARWPSPPST